MRLVVPSGSGSGMSIGGAVTSGTTGSVLFVGAGPILSQDNANLFWDDTNNYLGIGTNAPTAHLEIMSLSAANIGAVIQGASSQSGDLLKFLDSSASSMTAVSSNGFLRFFDSNVTFSTSSTLISTANTMTMAAANISTFVRGNHTISYTAAQNVFTGCFFFYSSLTLKNATSLTGSIGSYAGFYNGTFAQGDTNATVFNSYNVFFDQGGASIANAGTLAMTEYNSVNLAPGSIGAGVTCTNHRGVYIQNPAVAGTVTTNTRLEINDVTTGTTKLAMRVKGTTGVSRHQPKIKFGADTDPAVDVDINGAIAYAKSTVSLTADNQAVVTANKSYISLSSDSAVAANRDFVLNQSTVAGQILVLQWTGTNAGQMIDNVAQGGGGNTRLSALWLPTQYDTLTLISDGVDWVEIARSIN